jgi:hypothetical protein
LTDAADREESVMQTRKRLALAAMVAGGLVLTMAAPAPAGSPVPDMAMDVV